MFVEIKNNGPEIVSTNYYSLPQSQTKYFLSINAGAFRLLVPKNAKKEVQKEFKIARSFILNFGMWKNYGKGVQLIFEDFSNNPFQIFLLENAMDRYPPISEDGKERELIFYFHENNGKLENLPLTKIKLKKVRNL